MKILTYGIRDQLPMCRCATLKVRIILSKVLRMIWNRQKFINVIQNLLPITEKGLIDKHHEVYSINVS